LPGREEYPLTTLPAFFYGKTYKRQEVKDVKESPSFSKCLMVKKKLPCASSLSVREKKHQLTEHTE
jgi:hypothetical protein